VVLFVPLKRCFKHVKAAALKKCTVCLHFFSETSSGVQEDRKKVPWSDKETIILLEIWGDQQVEHNIVLLIQAFLLMYFSFSVVESYDCDKAIWNSATTFRSSNAWDATPTTVTSSQKFQTNSVLTATLAAQSSATPGSNDWKLTIASVKKTWGKKTKKCSYYCAPLTFWAPSYIWLWYL